MLLELVSLIRSIIIASVDQQLAMLVWPKNF